MLLIVRTQERTRTIERVRSVLPAHVEQREEVQRSAWWTRLIVHLRRGRSSLEKEDV